MSALELAGRARYPDIGALPLEITASREGLDHVIQKLGREPPEPLLEGALR